MVQIKRVYEAPSDADGLRVLVDRLWPRGVSKEKAKLDFWLKEVAPSDELRRWFAHDPAKWSEFKRRYLEELERNPVPVEQLRELVAKQSVTLLFAALDKEHNEAVVLRDLLS